MVSSPYHSSHSGRDDQPGPSKHAKPSASKSRTPWPLDTFWSISSRKFASQTKSRSPVSPVLGASYESSTGLDSDQNFDSGDLPLTPPDSGASAFELHAAPRDAQSTSRSAQDATSLLLSTAPTSTAILHGGDDEAKSPQKGRSKNDIFKSPIACMTPPPASDPPAPPSRNSLFFSSFGSSSPTPPSPPPPRISSVRTTSANSSLPPTPHSELLPAALPQPPPPPPPASDRKKGHSRNSSLGRASSEECLEEEARIRAAKHVDFRLCPTNEFLLGEGRHCSVYLGSYRTRADAVATGTTSSSSSGQWQLCAIKRLHANRQSQLLGLEEAFALRRLGLHPNIIQLIDIRDEVEFASPQPTPQPRERQLESISCSAGLGLGLGLPRNEGPSPSPDASNHSRSTSDMTGRDELLQETQSHKRALAHEKQHEAALTRGIIHDPPQSRTRMSSTAEQSLPTPTFLEPGLDGDSVGSPAPEYSLVPRTPGLPHNTPRLLILLELLPNNLARFARKHVDRIDLQQWFDWALQMTEAILFLHEKGCVHADIKKENMLLTEDLDIKLCDFNSAVFPNPNDPPRDGLGLGTPAYCAPELSRATGGPGATNFSYPIDIFSLGVVLYSLATGYEPFSKARSVVEMLHRKRLFFESEENDRASRLAVEAGSNPNSAPASRSGSLRGRHSHPHPHSSTANEGQASPTQLASSLNRLVQQNQGTGRRDASSDSLESVASSITTISGRKTTSMAVSRLLEPSDARGLLINPIMGQGGYGKQGGLLRDLTTAKVDLRRAASMGGKKAVGTRTGAVGGTLRSAPPIDASHESSTSKVATKGSPAVTRVAIDSRPDWLRRRSSYGDELTSTAASSHSQYLPTTTTTIFDHTTTEADPSSTPSKPSRLRPMFSPASTTLPHSSNSSSSTERRVSPHPSLPSNITQEGKAYADGHPPINLAGGGRLPDWARDLLRSMLQASPSARPTAVQVRERMLAHLNCI